jgi:hypothetical protein
MTSDDAVLDALRHAESVAGDERLVLLCFIASRHVTLAGEEVNPALRRSELLLAAGGDPRRPLELYGRAVTALADDLDEAERRGQLAKGLSWLSMLAERLPAATEALAALRHDSDLAWQCFAMALLAEALAEADY